LNTHAILFDKLARRHAIRFQSAQRIDCVLNAWQAVGSALFLDLFSSVHQDSNAEQTCLSKCLFFGVHLQDIGKQHFCQFVSISALRFHPLPAPSRYTMIVYINTFAKIAS